LVVLASSWTNSSEAPGLVGSDSFLPLDASRRALAVSLARTVHAITDRGINVLLMGQPPEFTSPPTSCFERAEMFHREPGSCVLMDSAASARRTHFADSLIQDLAQASAHVFAFFPAKVMCGTGLCSAYSGGLMFYRDRFHLTASGSRVLGRAIDLPPGLGLQPFSAKPGAYRRE
jgi:hypothetical protein